MAEIIRNRTVLSVNRLNKWPTNGLFTCSRTSFEHLDRRWFDISVGDVTCLIGNVFEQTDFNMIIFNITARRDYSIDNSMVIDLSVDRASIDVMPIEAQECHSLESYLKTKIMKLLCSHDYAEFKLKCYVKGWFW